MRKNKEKSGYWVQKTHLLKQDEYVCSSCGASYKKPFKNCPSCGMIMRSSKYAPSWVDEAEMLDTFFGD